MKKRILAVLMTICMVSFNTIGAFAVDDLTEQAADAAQEDYIPVEVDDEVEQAAEGSDEQVLPDESDTTEENEEVEADSQDQNADVSDDSISEVDEAEEYSVYKEPEGESQTEFVQEDNKEEPAEDEIIEEVGKEGKGDYSTIEFEDGNDVELSAGEEDYFYTISLYDIESVSSSNSSVVKVTRWDENCLYLKALKPGKATITVTSENGAVGKLSVTVTSFMKKTSVSVNSGKTVTVSVKDDSWGFSLVYITGTSSTNTNAVSVKRYGDYLNITGKYPGTSTITVKGSGGERSTIKVTVKPALSSTTNTPSVTYGSTKINGKTTPGAKVTAKILGKTYKATAAANGKYTVKIPVVKFGTKIYLKYTSAGTSLSKTISVKKGSPKIETTYWTYMNSTKVRGKAKNVHKGDYIKVVINGKTYKKKVTKDASSMSFSINISKPGKYGIKQTTSLYNKFNQCMAVEKEYVYKGDTVYVGDTKNTVKWLTYWNDPERKNYYTYNEQWCYDWNGDGLYDAYLYFRDGKVTDWTIYD